MRGYPELDNIPKEEWGDFFFNASQPWNKEDLDYLVEWYEKDNLLNLSYALGRTPATLISTTVKIRQGKMKYRNDNMQYVPYILPFGHPWTRINRNASSVNLAVV